MAVTRSFGSRAVAAVLVAVLMAWAAPAPLVAQGGNQTLLQAGTLFGMAKLKMKQGNFAEAELNLKKLVALPFAADPKSAMAKAAGYTVLVDSLVGQRKWEEALKVGLDALKLPCFATPSVYKAELFKLLSKIYEAKGRMDLSEQYLKSALDMFEKLAPKAPPVTPAGTPGPR